MIQNLASEGVATEEMTFTGPNLNAMASALLQTFRSRMIDLYRDELLIHDLQHMNIVERSFGFKLDPPKSLEHGHGDRAVSMAITLPPALDYLTADEPEFYETIAGTLCNY